MDLIIIGAGGHGTVVADMAMSAGYNVLAFVDSRKIGSKIVGVDVIPSVTELSSNIVSSCGFVIAIGDNFSREIAYRDLLAILPNAHFPMLSHPSATISSFASIGQGTVVLAQSYIGPNCRVGQFCILNTQASLDHDSELCDFSTLAPKVSTGGNVYVGRRSAVCIGATLKQRVRVGADSVIGAHSFLNSDVPDCSVVYGAPARIVRSRSPCDSYLH